MSVQTAPSKMISQMATPSDAQTRLYGRWLLLTRVMWFIAVGLTVAFFVLGFPLQIARSQTLCYNSDASQCFQAGQLTPELVQELQQLGLSLNFYGGYFTAVQLIFAFVFLAVGVLIFWRKSDDWMALLISLMLVIFGLASFNSPANLLAPVYPVLRLPSLVLQFLGVALLMFFFFLFPDGRFVPRWTRWVMPFVIVREGINVFLPDSELGGGNTGRVLILIEVALALFAQIFRYRRVSGSVQRQQTKWVVFGVAAALIGYFGVISVGGLLIPKPTVLTVMFIDALLVLFVLLIPLSILVAILRFRLYEIDLLINRTLVYVPLTAILAGIFAASITLSQKFFVALTGQSSDVATVLTTLIVVAAFTPIKDRLQAVVDKRFKEGADPARQLKAFAERVQTRVNPVEAHQLTRRLLEEAMTAFGATSAALYWLDDGKLEARVTAGEWNGEGALRVNVATAQNKFGEIRLGARRNGADYSAKDRAVLEQVAQIVARAIEEDRDA